MLCFSVIKASSADKLRMFDFGSVYKDSRTMTGLRINYEA